MNPSNPQILISWGTVIFPFATGTLLYFFRPVRPLFLEGVIEVFPGFEMSFSRFQRYSENWPDWVLYNLPDGLWLLGFGGLFFLLWQASDGKTGLMLVSLLLLAALTGEFLQIADTIRGQFDAFDLLAYLLAYIVAILLNQINLKNQKA